MARYSNLGWKWTDDSGNSFSNWEEGNPNNTKFGDADCAAMNQNGKWVDLDCTRFDFIL